MVVFKVNHHIGSCCINKTWKGNLLVCGFHFATNDTVAKTVVVLVVFIAPHDQHLHQGQFFSEALVQVFKSLSDSSRGDKRL